MSLEKRARVLLEAGPDSIPGRIEPKGEVQDLGGPVVTPDASKGPGNAIAAKQPAAKALPANADVKNVGGGPNPTKYKSSNNHDDLDPKKELGEGEGEDEDEKDEKKKVVKENRLPSWLKARLVAEAEEEDDKDDDDDKDEKNEAADEDDDKSDEWEKKLTAKQKKEAADDEDDDEEEDDKEAEAKKDEQIAESMNSMNEALDSIFSKKLSESTRNQLKAIFEAAISERVGAELEYVGKQFNREVEKQVMSIAEEMENQVDRYLNHIVESWVGENQIAIERGIRNELMEDFVVGLKNLFTEHYIEIPETKVDVVSKLAERVEYLESELNEQLTQNVNLREAVNYFQKMEIVNTVSEGLTEVQADKLAQIAENMDFEDEDTFRSKLETLKENYVPAKQPKRTSLTEDVNDSFTSKSGSNSEMDAYKLALARTAPK